MRDKVKTTRGPQSLSTSDHGSRLWYVVHNEGRLINKSDKPRNDDKRSDWVTRGAYCDLDAAHTTQQDLCIADITFICERRTVVATAHRDYDSTLQHTAVVEPAPLGKTTEIRRQAACFVNERVWMNNPICTIIREADFI
ncbi:uncharacterized protein SPSK_10721 [Sporothrix schenckii 1099-18]|uniref:Uncharacterized protein n=1 Tax=Sporothrix schenckii 1099-18 TaxID=1397361 RepID=A0A0F2MP48_SPOSC|nr:uncharacterized protein SPSK_10721 [Sporothrix schenckii 1099-18]KJR89941.1 hypothetical protein SPSK_10721 [Sporothrix schenckii 1099-18]